MYTPYPMRLMPAEAGGDAGDSFEVSCRKGGSVIGNGALAGTPLEEFLKSVPAASGTRAKRFVCFPMLLRLDRRGDDVSVTVRASDACVPKKEKQYGKAKWYVAEYSAPAGAAQAVCKGVTRAEAQEGSENPETSRQDSLFTAEKNGNIITHLAHDKYFSVYELRFRRAVKLTMNERSFNSLTFVSGEGTIECGGAEEEFMAGQSFFIPCPAQGYTIKGEGTAVMCKLEGDNMHKSFDK